MDTFEKPFQNFEKIDPIYDAYEEYAKSKKPFVEFNKDYSIATLRNDSALKPSDLAKMIEEISNLGFVPDEKTFSKDYTVFERKDFIEIEDEKKDDFKMAA